MLHNHKLKKIINNAILVILILSLKIQYLNWTNFVNMIYFFLTLYSIRVSKNIIFYKQILCTRYALSNVNDLQLQIKLANNVLATNV